MTFSDKEKILMLQVLNLKADALVLKMGEVLVENNIKLPYEVKNMMMEYAAYQGMMFTKQFMTDDK